MRARRGPEPSLGHAAVTFCTIVAGYEVDAYWPAKHLVAELDGEEFHHDFEADRLRTLLI